jgi:hypothetical protein
MKSLTLKKVVLAVALAAAPMLASAESDLNTAAGPSASSARLDFRIIVPRFLYLAVGTNTAMADNTSVDRVEWNVTLANLGTGALAPTSATGLGHPVPVRLMGNGGAIGLTSTTTTAGLTNVAGDVISWTTITGTGTGGITHPNPIATGTSASSPIAATTGTKVTDRTGTWTFSYSNAAVVPEGTYNGQVTYTASMP